MNETYGWKSGGRHCGCWKHLRGVRYEISEGIDFVLYSRPNGHAILIGAYDTLADAKRAAHQHSKESHP